MRIVTFSPAILQIKGANSFYPDIPYLIAEEEYQSMIELYKTSGIEFVSDMKPFTLPNWKSADVKSLLVWNTGRTGDQLWTTAIIRKIKSLYPQMKIDVVTDGGSEQVYQFNKDIRAYKAKPIPLSVIPEYDAILFYDETVARRTDEDQPNCYQILFEEAGLPFERKDCKPFIHLKHTDENNAFVKAFGNKDTEIFSAFVLLGLASESAARNLTATQWAQVISILEEKGKGNENFTIFGLSANGVGGEIQDALAKYKFAKYVPLHGVLNLREIAALMRHSLLTISVDTMFPHLAGALGAPCLVLPSVASPDKRFGTYDNQISGYNPKACQHAACYWKGSNFYHFNGENLEFAACYTPQITQCKVLRSLGVNEFQALITSAIINTHQLEELKPLPL